MSIQSSINQTIGSALGLFKSAAKQSYASKLGEKQQSIEGLTEAYNKQSTQLKRFKTKAHNLYEKNKALTALQNVQEQADAKRTQKDTTNTIRSNKIKTGGINNG